MEKKMAKLEKIKGVFNPPQDVDGVEDDFEPVVPDNQDGGEDENEWVEEEE